MTRQDFAECFAHYLHITDTIDTSREAAMVCTPIERVLSDWQWMSTFFNRVNTAMGKNPPARTAER